MTTGEAQLNTALGEALLKDVAFSQWFLAKTRFKDQSANCVFCRSNNPWSRVTLEAPVKLDGSFAALVRECETDVLAVYETAEKHRLALHIENKLAGGSFTSNQPELYRARLQQWRNRPKLGFYSDAASVLIAPQSFFARLSGQAQIFDVLISHEDIACWLPIFSPASHAQKH